MDVVKGQKIIVSDYKFKRATVSMVTRVIAIYCILESHQESGFYSQQQKRYETEYIREVA